MLAIHALFWLRRPLYHFLIKFPEPRFPENALMVVEYVPVVFVGFMRCFKPPNKRSLVGNYRFLEKFVLDILVVLPHWCP